MAIGELACYFLVSNIAEFIKDGENDNNDDEFTMTGDDAIDTLHEIIDKARVLVSHRSPAMIDWIDSADSLPQRNQRVLAWLEGFRAHSDATWERNGYAFMIRHPDDPASVKDGWERSFYERALKDLDADGLEVTHWLLLTSPVQP